MQVQAYLTFDGRAEEAIGFYSKAIGAKVEAMLRFKESPEPTPPGMLPPGSENKIMHSALRIGDTQVFVSDGMCRGVEHSKFDGFSLSLEAANEAEADRLFAALGDGGQVQMPMGKTFFAKRFGVVSDRFGVSWLVIVPAEA